MPWPGGLAQGRSIEPVPMDGRVLGAELAHLNPPYLSAPKGVTITQADYRWLSLGTRHPRAILTAARVSARAGPGKALRHKMPSSQSKTTWLRVCGAIGASWYSAPSADVK